MRDLVYTPEELERIQMALLGLLCYARRHDARPLPRCFQFCDIMVRNIDHCRSSGYEGRDELSGLLQEDWKHAMEIHSGLPEYYLPNDQLEVQSSMNHALCRQIDVVDRLIAPRRHKSNETEP